MNLENTKEVAFKFWLDAKAKNKDITIQEVMVDYANQDFKNEEEEKKIDEYCKDLEKSMTRFFDIGVRMYAKKIKKEVINQIKCGKLKI
jgi:Pyruvate/2-oxoacid:ferredoxin oxidoreductase gamma subunit